MLDARFVREAVEADIVSLLVTQHDRNLIVELRAQLKEQRRVAKLPAYQFMELDEKFHRTLARAAKKKAKPGEYLTILSLRWIR